VVRLLRTLVRLLFRAAAVAALLWVARELMRRWVDGPEKPQVAGNWETWEPTASPGPAPGRVPAGADGAPAPGEPAEPAAAARAADREPAAADPEPADPEPAAAGAAAPAPAPEQPEKRKPRPLKAARIAKAAPPAARAGGAAPPAARAGGPATGATEPAPAGEPAAKKARRKATAGTWVSPNGSGEAPSTHPVKAKLVSRLYRVPGMPMYNRIRADRCYESPEAAEADGFTRAAR
jgi:hypothetical protein